MSDIRLTLDWHRAVAEAKEEWFGEQPLHDRIRLSEKLVGEEVGELEMELRRARGYARDGQPIPTELTAAAAKEAADVLFVVIQAMHTLGVPFEEVYAEVLRSNWSKLPQGGPSFRADGKLLKPPSYSEADIAGVLQQAEERRQRAQEAYDIGLGFRPEGGAGVP